MSAREDLKKIQDELSELEMQQEALRALEYPLIVKRHETIQRLIDEEKPFKGSEWELKFNHSGKLFLDYLGSRFDDEMQEINDLCSHSWHSDFQLEEGVRLDFDDNQLSLTISDPSKIADVVQRHGLVVIAKDLNERAALLHNELAGLALVQKQLGLPTT